MSYQIFTDATADMSFEMLKGLPEIKVIPMNINFGDSEFIYGPEGNISVEKFYAVQRSGQFASTSQISPSTYFSYFEPCLKAGEDILYLCFTSGMSGTYQTAMLCAQDLRTRFPERKIICIDTLCASVGEGLLVQKAAEKQCAGVTIDELAEWIIEHRLKVCHWFTVDTFEHLKHGGRVSSAAATVGTVLQIKPLLHVEEQGCLQVKEKPRGRKKAISTLLTKMEQGWDFDLGEQVVIGHGDNYEAACQLREGIINLFPNAKIHVADIGPIIGSHTGPGMLAVVYWGNNR